MAGQSSQPLNHSPAPLAETGTCCLRTDTARSPPGTGQAGDAAAPLEGQRENPLDTLRHPAPLTLLKECLAGPSSLCPLVSRDPGTRSAKLHVCSWTVSLRREQNPTATSCLLEHLQCGIHVPPHPSP